MFFKWNDCQNLSYKWNECQYLDEGHGEVDFFSSKESDAKEETLLLATKEEEWPFHPDQMVEGDSGTFILCYNDSTIETTLLDVCTTE